MNKPFGLTALLGSRRGSAEASAPRPTALSSADPVQAPARPLTADPPFRPDSTVPAVMPEPADSAFRSDVAEAADRCLALVDDLAAGQKNWERVRGCLEVFSPALAALSEVNQSIQENADQVCGVADNLAGSAETGFELARNVQSNVVRLADNIGVSLTETGKLLEESKRISDILTIMSEIASSTNVLSINASIVAARAGIKGREFDVVAKEVRKLSISTEESLTNIAFLVKDLQAKVRSVSNKLQDVTDGILREKDAMLSVAGALQGVTLAVEVIRSVSAVSGDKAKDGRKSVAEAMKVMKDAQELVAGDAGVDGLGALRQELAALRALSVSKRFGKA